MSMPLKTGVNHECGVFSIYSNENKNLAQMVYFGLFSLQHRGQESAGISVTHNKSIRYYKNLGLVSKVFDPIKLSEFPEGNIAIGHVRYAPTNNQDINSIQPIRFTSSFGKMSIAMNGNIINSAKLRNILIEDGHIFQSKSDAEVVAALINKYAPAGDIVTGIKLAVEQLVGSYAIVINTTTKLIAIRDPNAIMPLVLGKLNEDYIVASESCAIDNLNGSLIREIGLGEMLVINNEGLTSYYMKEAKRASCIFEMIYLSRSDSIVCNRSIYNSRFETGVALAKKYKIDADLVAGAPDSGVIAARGYSVESGIPYKDILCKNRYVGRSFILPEQQDRETSVKIKLNAVRSNIEGKKVILIDDSIVRGTTSRKIIKLIKNAGAKEVHLLIASPPIINPCYYGVDMRDRKHLMAANLTIDEMCKIVEADSINYLPVDDIIECCGGSGFCTACFTGDYPTEIE